MKSAAAHFALDSAADIVGAIPSARNVYCSAEGLLGAAHECMCFSGGGRDFDRYCGIGMESISFSGQIELDEIAGLDHAIAGNSVNDLIVHADAGIARESVDHRRRGMCSVSSKNAGTDFGELRRCDAGTYFSGHGSEGSGDDPAASEEFFKLLCSRDGHDSPAEVEFKIGKPASEGRRYNGRSTGTAPNTC